MSMKTGWIVLLVVALAAGIFYPPSRPITVPFLIGGIAGWLLRLVAPPRLEIPLKPLSRGWIAVWWVTVGLAVVSAFVPILRYFLPLLLIVIFWGHMMYRYRRKQGVQP